MHCVQSYHHTILVNVPLQISVTREAGWVIVGGGGDNGFAQIFDYQTGAFQEKLDHGSAGELIVVVTAFEGTHGCTIATASALDGTVASKCGHNRNNKFGGPVDATIPGIESGGDISYE
ncbi:hypothetical protein PAXRUDRAFT_20010 [Paxillus rubicundulus Ve08.2h10]|uniref:Uncharacterized protein n=1 Tax=Paxillus rubicundulus Ve08.2h10 TaxID=930991 RepID=A0A0D0BS52_9AGAM|nr:hypothetical protein PAXRUDRAFT_20010 [Paxillus rubicundulus Ve08.2h10]